MTLLLYGPVATHYDDRSQFEHEDNYLTFEAGVGIVLVIVLTALCVYGPLHPPTPHCNRLIERQHGVLFFLLDRVLQVT